MVSIVPYDGNERAYFADFALVLPECAEKGRKMSDCALLSPREMAEKSGWPERRIRSLIASKQIKHLKIGSTFYLPEDAIADFVRRNMVEPEQGGSADVPGQD